MKPVWRTPSGGCVDRATTLPFTFDGRRFTGHPGDTLASALLANGVRAVGRSFKYHRPRGILSAGSEEPNALVTIDRGPGQITPNLRATQVELYPGLRAVSQNRWPSLDFDLGALAGLASPLLGAGFYYKTFMWPPTFWKRVYEPLIRRAAGLGRAPHAADPDRYLHRYAHCDVLVVGGGPAGLTAALSASAAGARVLLCDEQAEFGGALLHETESPHGVPATSWATETVARLAARGVTLLARTTAFGWFPDNLIGLVERVTDHLADPAPALPRERLWQVRARQVVLATGAIERPVVFPGNDRPGVMLAEAARCYLHRYGVQVGSRAVVVTQGDSAYRAALELHRAGVAIRAIADLRDGPDEALVDAVRTAGIEVLPGAVVTGTSGRTCVRRVRIEAGGRRHSYSCDAVLMSGGWTPSVHLFAQSRGRLRFDAELSAFLPGEPAAAVRCVGACAGVFDLAEAMEAGDAAGAAAAAGMAPPVPAVPSGQPRGGRVMPRIARGRAFVDFQNDVTTKDLRLATDEGFHAIEHVKRYTTTGMATDQGKTSNLNALGIVADILHRPVPQVGHTTFRMPYTPVTFGALAGAARGALFEPVRRTPLHEWAAEQAAIFEDAGAWKRPHYFPRTGEDMHAAVARECRAVRGGVGMFDASTLGKIEVVGADAATFLERIYTGRFARLPPGRCRYGLMLSETGFVLDDGVVARLAPDRFHLTTTTGGAAFVLHHMEDYLQTEFTDLKVWLTSTTEHWAVIALQGPEARAVLSPLVEGIDLAPDAMPHMSVREGTVAGVPARLFRVSFTGERGYEINVPAEHASAVWVAIYAAGAAFGITPYGTEAMHVLRAEKGYIVVGQETDGTVTPDDLGLGWAVGASKPDFVGKRSLARPDMVRTDRKQLVGLLTADPDLVLEEGAQLVSAGSAALGHVTSAYWSATLGRSIALALLAGGRERIGSAVEIPMPGRTIPARVTGPVFYDPHGERLHG